MTGIENKYQGSSGKFETYLYPESEAEGNQEDSFPSSVLLADGSLGWNDNSAIAISNAPVA